MRQLVPDVAVVEDLPAHEASLRRPAPAQRPWVLCNMIASADGAVEVGGVSGPLGGPADKQVFRALRAVADVVLVAAGTVRQERYHAPRAGDQGPARQRRGQAPRPRLAVVTASCDLDPGLGLFQDPANRPYVLTAAAAPAERRDALGRHAEVAVVGEDRVDLAAALALLHRHGARVVLVEGGPSLNGQLLARDLVDEWRLTVSPLLVAGSSARAAVGPPVPDPVRFRLERVLLGDDLLFLRYLRP